MIIIHEQFTTFVRIQLYLQMFFPPFDQQMPTKKMHDNKTDRVT